MKNTIMNNKLISRFAHWEPARILVASLLLAATVITGLPMVIKLFCVALAMFVLLVTKCRQEEYTEIQIFGVCFAVAMGVISICSKSSFLYPLNDWVDANCFFTVGKSMMNGIVPYRDILEQKGPFLYFIHGLAWLISNDSFIGVYLFEVLAATFFLYYVHRSLRLFINSSWTVFLIPVAAAAVYTCDAFRHGDSVEELVLPFLAYALWLGMDAISNNRDITRKEYFIVGLTSGLIFWSKFTVVGFYLGWYLFPAVKYIRKRQWKSLGQSVLYILLGVAAATLPFVIYFGIHGAISDWLTVYLYDNLFVYTKSTEQQLTLFKLVKNIGYGVSETIRRNPLIAFLSLFGLLFFLVRQITVCCYFLVTAAFMLFFAFVGGVYYPYYSFSFNLFLPFGLLPVLSFLMVLYDQCERWKPKRRYLLPLIVILLVVCLQTTSNKYLLGTPKEEMPQYQFASIIGEDRSATLLNYGFLDGGFYTTSNIVPNCKVFCLLNISARELLEIQNDYIEQGAVDYIVTRGSEITDSKYERVAVSEFYYRDELYWYFLYQRV